MTAVCPAGGKGMPGSMKICIPDPAVRENFLKAVLQKSSANKYEDILRCYILPELGECRLSQIT